MVSYRLLLIILMEGLEGFTGTSGSVVSSGQAGSLTAGDTFQIRLSGGWDSSVKRGDPAWDVSSLSVNGSPTAVPFGV